MNLRRHLAAVLSVQSSRRAISVSLSPAAANSTTFARITSRWGRVYWPARRRSSRSSVSLKVITTAAITPGIRHPYGNSSRTYLREPVLVGQRPLVDVPRLRRRLAPGPRGRVRRRAPRGVRGGHHARHVALVDEGHAAIEHLAQRRAPGGDDGRAAGERLDGGEPEALARRGQHERAGAGVEGRELVVAHLAGEDHVRQLARPLPGHADEHERELARRLDERGYAAVRIGVAEVSHPQQVVLGYSMAQPRGVDLGALARREGGRGRLRDHVDALTVEVQDLRGVLGHDAG